MATRHPSCVPGALPRLALVVFLAACADGSPDPLSGPELPDPAAGAQAFAAECALCHAGGDGFDLAFFGFTDTTIVRRAVAHVDTATAWTIVAHVRSLDVLARDRDTRPFQPLASPVDTDLAFAVGLFGEDAWPVLGEAALAGIDPRVVATAVAFPVWSDEESNLDWMPDRPLPEAVLAARGGLARSLLAGYAASPTDENLTRAVAGLRALARDRNDAQAPCRLVDDLGRVADPDECFNTTRWISGLAAQHMLRFGVDLPESAVVHDAFWDVGMAARRSLVLNGDPVENAEENWGMWMYVGWVFQPGNHASTYTATGLARMGLPRHATFVALRSLVDRPSGSPAPYKDLRVAAQRAPTAWLAAAYETGLGVLEARDARGMAPAEGEARAEAVEALVGAAQILQRRLGSTAAQELVQRTAALGMALSAPPAS